MKIRDLKINDLWMSSKGRLYTKTSEQFSIPIDENLISHRHDCDANVEKVGELIFDKKFVNIGVVCLNIDDFIKWGNELPVPPIQISERILIFEGNVRCFRISTEYNACGLDLDRVIITQSAEKNPKYEMIMQSVKPCIKTLK